jgi:hypothetical protein
MTEAESKLIEAALLLYVEHGPKHGNRPLHVLLLVGAGKGPSSARDDNEVQERVQMRPVQSCQG